MGNVYNFLMAFSAAMGGLLFGYEIGVIGQVLAMDSTFGVYYGLTSLVDGKYVATDANTSRTGDITSLFLVGCLVGALAVSWMADVIGRKKSILVGGVLFTAGAVLQTFSNGFGMLIAGRIIGGAGIGILSMVAPLYIAETAPAHLRGRMVTVQQLMITIGIFVASCINAIIIKTVDGDTKWRLALGMQMVPGVVLFFLTFIMPESPRWLANRDQDAEALRTLAKLRSVSQDDPAVIAEHREIKESIEMERQIGTANWSELLKPGILNRTVYGFLNQMFQQWTGINYNMYYAPKLIERMGFNKDDADIPFTIANNFINLIGTFPGMYLIERSGRRKLFLWGALGMGISQLLTCLFANLSTNHGKGFSWAAIFAVYGFVLNFAATWGPVVWVYQSEIFPLRVRSKGTGFATMSNWGNNAIIGKVGPIMTANIEFYTYLVFGIIALTAGVYVYFFIPETMGKSLEDMDVVFGATPTTHHAAQKELEEAEVEATKAKA
ncbi:sugar transporter [Fimicolochytrium jonesii]|uniref:sugar transporter n=1 Tax=Fimicolochytrium jonesii TaxID=1396493 RepID=UPI0022FE14F6|nr:sugar transporter [Fimicolochytrium jonesii]KAI8820678.1 sugar transporter [Fimicolochytrium jonesii]